MDSHAEVRDLLDSGYCKIRAGGKVKITPLKPEYRIGIPEDDLILTPEEYHLIANVICPKDRRFRLLWGMLPRTGGRITQNLTAKVHDIDFVRGRLFVNRSKLGDPFYRDLDEGFLRELSNYIFDYGLQKDDYLFSIFYKNENLDDWYKKKGHISRKTADDWIDHYAKKAGVQYYYIDEKGFRRRRISAHVTKRTFLSMVYAETGDGLLTARSVGNRTQWVVEKHYIKVASKRKHEAVKNAIRDLTGRDDIQLTKISQWQPV